MNSDIVGKFVNIASRCSGFITSTSGGQLARCLPDPELYAEFVAAGEDIAKHYEARDYRHGRARDHGAVRSCQPIRRFAQTLDARQGPGKRRGSAGVCTQALNLFRVLMIYLAPVLPHHGGAGLRIFSRAGTDLGAARQPLLATSINAYEPLAVRLDPKAVATR